MAGSRKPSYLVFSRSMLTYAGFYNAPKGIPMLLRKVEHTPSAWQPIYSQGGVKSSASSAERAQPRRASETLLRGAGCWCVSASVLM